MFDFIFDNSGDKIKRIAKVVFYLEFMFFFIMAIISFILSGVCFVNNPELLLAPAIVFIISGIVCIVYGILFSWLSVVILYAFGELVADTRLIKLKLYNEPVTTAKTESKITTKPEKFIDPDSPKVIIEKGPNGTWFCPECARHNSIDVNSCKCGFTRN